MQHNIPQPTHPPQENADNNYNLQPHSPSKQQPQNMAYPLGGQPVYNQYYGQERQPPHSLPSQQHHTPYDQYPQNSYPNPYAYLQQYQQSYYAPTHYAPTQQPTSHSCHPPTNFYGYAPNHPQHPSLPFIDKVFETDVLCGRGGVTNNYAGNKSFRSLVKKYQLEYLQAKKKEKPLVADKIVEKIKAKGGRFLIKDKATGYWLDIGDIRAREKTSQALREGAPVLKKLHPPIHSSSSKTESNDIRTEEEEQRKKRELKNEREGCSPKDPVVTYSALQLSAKRKAMSDAEILKTTNKAEEKEKVEVFDPPPSKERRI